MSQQPTVGRIVHYRLSEQDAEQITNRRRDAGAVGNSVRAGDTYPMVIVGVWSPTLVNGQVVLDGPDTLWVTSVTLGDGPRTWSWPPRVEG